MRNRLRGRSGFTLLELVIAGTIVGIIVIMSFSNLTLWMDHSSAVGFRKEILSMSEEARTRAMASNLQHRVQFDLDEEIVRLQRGNAGTGSTSWNDIGNTLTGSRGAGVHEIVYDGVTASSTTCSFIYNPGGQMLVQDNTSTILPLVQATVHLDGKNSSDRATIRLYGYTSKARLEENGWY